jgi:hypothetical protein
MSPNAGGGGEGCGILANEYSFAHGAQIIFGDLSPYVGSSQQTVKSTLKEGAEKV